ncbi:hypothetical protein D7231_31825 [Streptomyces klenkii]|uniref:Uncharacterized protein n=1 Tax=Streptomyces klenkii TaxID=1420899 RepID=A0A3B0AMT7_9ACTN|nr:hypothetical protein [Streptomyces klenkii]RKN61863.1 hypothetical protein D7231_31825 [Streptomyces klenkii]
MLPWYCTREEVKAELDYKETARADRRIDRAVESASRTVEGLLHRRFYPELGTRYFDWPNAQRARPWRLWLDDNELISVTSLMSGGVTIAAGDYFLEPNTSGPPFRRLELDLDSNAAFGGGDTHQRDIAITGLWGYRDDETPLGATVGALDAAETGIDVDAATSAEVGVGSLLRIDDERVLVTGRAQLDTGQTVGADLAAQANAVTVQVGSGAAFASGETILVDSERMLIVDIAGNSLTVKRGWDGSVLATHTTGAAVYAPRTLTVRRGVLGTTAATHASSATVHRWDPPPPVRELSLAEAVNQILQGQAGWGKAGRGGLSQRESEQIALQRLRERVYTSHGRKARLRGV